MSATAAKAAIEADGYKGVRALARGSDGVWRATALRGQTEVLLSVGPTGRIIGKMIGGSVAPMGDFEGQR